MSDDEACGRDMGDADWARVYERQRERAALVDRLAELLELEGGDTVLDVGAGPGLTAARLATHVTPGTVYALDRQPGALRYLRTQTDIDMTVVRPVAGDLTALPVRFTDPTPTLASLVLHHVESPERALAELAAVLPVGSPLLVVGYHPEAEQGPPREHRIDVDRLRAWLTATQFTVTDTLDLDRGMYAVCSRR